MIRIVTLAAVAAFAVAAPAAAKSIRVATAGKSTEQVQAEVSRAARVLCARESIGASFPYEHQRACVKLTVAKTMQQFAAAPASTTLAAAQ
ncbi:hypothetical protein [Phenylobacterium sp. J367]|uniref:hypothetical protein n=1 Tax=Phenylobacterium sp. J367 TaxID=2898435 RepID=UPI00215143CF|nr:hypothetical protein [Phenylobacterium sp. J367]MCR5880900.1 hypothetical protein [Phenylobacterium sp. J367]